MAEEATPVERQAVPTKVDHREWEKDGKTKHAWTVSFEGGVKADTWSGEASKVCEENIGKPLLVSVVDTGRTFRDSKVFDITKIRSADGSAELYSGGQTKRGGQRGNYSQRPDWSYEDREERDATRRSIEAQVAEKAAAEYFAALVQYSSDEKLATQAGALEFAEKMATSIAIRLGKRTASKKSGPGHRESGPEAGGSRAASDDTMDAPGAGSEAGGEVATASESPAAPPPASGGGVPTSGPDSSAELVAARNAAIEVFKTPKSVEKAFAMGNSGQLVKFNDLTAEQLAGLAANPPSGSQQTEPETAGMAGGWS